LFTSAASLSPAKDQVFWIRKPVTQFPGMASATKAGPADHLSLEKRSSVAVGSPRAPPIPYIQDSKLFGLKYAV